MIGKIFLLIPAFLYLLFLIQNIGILSITYDVQFIFFGNHTIPVVGSITLFFIVYIALVIAIYFTSSTYKGTKARKLEKQVFDLKSKLLDKQGDLIKNIESKFSDSVSSIKAENDKKLELYKKENEKVVSQMNLAFDLLGNKIEKMGKQK